MSYRMRPLAACLMAGGLLTLAAGCGDDEPVVAAAVANDPARAQQALAQALDAWKAGQSRDTLATLTPPVRVADEDWLAGAKLVDYKVAEASRSQSSGGTTYWPVELTLSGTNGPPTRKATYVITTTADQTSVSRQD